MNLNDLGDRNLAAVLWAVMQEERFEDFDGLQDRQQEFWIEMAQRFRTLVDVLTAGAVVVPFRPRARGEPPDV